MEWKQIMAMKNPHEALKQIEAKVDRENLPIDEMEAQTEKYAKLHGITVEQMAFYPSGEMVLNKYPSRKKLSRKPSLQLRRTRAATTSLFPKMV